MRYLMLSDRHTAPPADQMKDLLAATQQWVKSNSANIVASWSNAGKPGGGGLIDVDSHEQLESIMIGFPLSRYSNISITPVLDLDASIDMIRAAD